MRVDKMQITYTHTVLLANGKQTTFESCWCAEDVVGGLTFIQTQNGVEYHTVTEVIKTTKTVQYDASDEPLKKWAW